MRKRTSGGIRAHAMHEMSVNAPAGPKSEIVRTIADKTGLTQVKAEDVVDAIFDEIKTTLSQGDVVILRRFGTFSVRAKKARQGRNPKTGEPSEISARHVVRFRPGRQLKAAAAHAPRAMSRERKAR